MTQFLSVIFFFLDFFNFCWVFQKFPFFCVVLYILVMNIDSFERGTPKSINNLFSR